MKTYVDACIRAPTPVILNNVFQMSASFLLAIARMLVDPIRYVQPVNILLWSCLQPISALSDDQFFRSPVLNQ